MLIEKIKMLNYLNKRDKRIKFKKSENKFTSFFALKKARQLAWKIKSKYLPILQNASYCYSFVWVSKEAQGNKKYYVVDIYDYVTYARVLKNPSEIYKLPEFTDKISYTKLYNNINGIIGNFLSPKEMW
ncbi:MAG: hypothetical protein FWH24_00860 [Oscillospiraceae bacterium]|nr:hypothetical protein [Oscillospiraceae bacterium]